MCFKIEFYKKRNGRKPAEEFLNNLDKRMRDKMNLSLSLIEKYGNYAGEKYSKHLEGEIYEARARYQNNITRILYFFFDGDQVILTHGFIKKTQKTPRNEIERAKRYRIEYFARKKDKK